MLKKTLLVSLTLVINVGVWAQNYSVKCVVTDSLGEGEPYATVRIYSTAMPPAIIKTDVTDENGNFTGNLSAPGEYVLKVTAVAKKEQSRSFALSETNKSVDLGQIVLTETDNVLADVVVTAMRPLVKSEIDRLSYDVQGDAESRTNTIMDMLRKVPLVTVDAQDNIMVKGGSNFKIYKNGHPDLSMSNNPKEVLKAIPASMVKRIEVITEPGAKYDAEGVSAILNIVMVDNSAVKGATGTVRAGVSSYGWNPEASAYLTTQIGKFIASVNYGYHNQSRKAGKYFSESHTTYVSDGREKIESLTANSRVNVHYGNIEASYEPDTLNLLTLSFGGFFYNYNQNSLSNLTMNDADGNMLYGYGSETKGGTGSFYSFDGRFDYQHRTHRKDELVTFSYMLGTSRQKSDYVLNYVDMVNMPVPYSGICNDGRENFWEHTFQLDWTRPFAKYHKIETGGKYIYRLNKSENTIAYTGTDNDVYSKFNHLTQVAAVYASYTFTKGAWAARAGLRYEHSYLSAQYKDGSQPDYHSHLNDWVPSASVNWQIDWSNSLKWAFATRISRPGISYLNPVRNETAQSVHFGNPHLSSARNYSTSLTYMHIGRKFTFNISPSFSYSNSGIGMVQYYEDGKEVSTYGNVLRETWVGINGYFQWQIHEKSSLMFNGNIGREYQRASSLGLKNSGWNSFFFSQFTQQLPWKLRLTAHAGKWGGGISGLYGKTGTAWFYGFGLQRSFLREDRLTVSVSAHRPFSSRYMRMSNKTIQGDYVGESISKFTNSGFRLNISYRFGSLNASVKKTNTTIDNNDLVGGSSAGGNSGGGNAQQQPGGN